MVLGTDKFHVFDVLLRSVCRFTKVLFNIINQPTFIYFFERMCDNKTQHRCRLEKQKHILYRNIQDFDRNCMVYSGQKEA